MNVSLTPELEALIDERVKSGLYNSASEVIREALRLFMERDQLKQLKLEELKRQIQTGVDASKAGQVLSEEAVLKRIASRRNRAPSKKGQTK